MKKMTKKLLSVQLALVMSLSVFGGVMAFADDLVAINSTTFPDATFRQVIAEYYDENGDGYLSLDERSSTFMSVSGMIDTETQTIESLAGIEYFPNIKTLRCGGIGLTELDVSQLTSLASLTCQGNKLTSIDLTKNPELLFINCADNELEELSFSGNDKVTELYCYANNLSVLDVAHLTSLQILRCDQNNLSYLDLTKNVNLTELNCTINHITSLDLSKNTLLGEVTNAMIGEQEITLNAVCENDVIYVDFYGSGLHSLNYASCSLDVYEDGSGYDVTNGRFVAYDVSQIANGIDYECNTMLATSENMRVHVNITRDFYQVNFYTGEDKTVLLGKDLVTNGSAATAPEITDVPQCKAFDTWSESIDSVTADMNVYPLWKDSHAYAVTAFDGDIVTITCADCGEGYTVSFKTLINAKSADSNYDQYVDVTGDGFINAKDYAELIRMFQA